MRRIFFVRKRCTAMERARRVSRVFIPLLFLLFVCLGHISPTGAALATYSGMQEDTGNVSQVDKRSLKSTNTTLWENGIIPYIITVEDTLQNKELYVRNLMTAMSWWENSTCIRFVDYTDQPHHVVFRLRPGLLRCFAPVGRPPSESRPFMCSLYESCLDSVGKIAHELGHVIGFFHEHLRHDRDQYIQINWSNLASESIKESYETVEAHYTYVGTTYDPGSIMHYAPFNFDTLNNSVPAFTLHKNVRYSGEIGQRRCFSKIDVEATNKMYTCPKSAVPINSSHVCDEEILTVDAVYSGDIIGLKFKNSSFNRWIECNGEVCRATGCPGNEFHEGYVENNICSSAMFTVVTLDPDISKPVKVGGRIALAVKDPSNGNNLLPLYCSPTGGSCSLNTNTSCQSSMWQYQNISDCQFQTFKVVVPGKGKDYLQRNSTLILQDSDHSKLSLGCDYSARRRRQRKCYLKKCTSHDGCARKRQRLLVFSLSP